MSIQITGQKLHHNHKLQILIRYHEMFTGAPQIITL